MIDCIGDDSETCQAAEIQDAIRVLELPVADDDD